MLMTLVVNCEYIRRYGSVGWYGNDRLTESKAIILTDGLAVCLEQEGW